MCTNCDFIFGVVLIKRVDVSSYHCLRYLLASVEFPSIHFLDHLCWVESYFCITITVQFISCYVLCRIIGCLLNWILVSVCTKSDLFFWFSKVVVQTFLILVLGLLPSAFFSFLKILEFVFHPVLFRPIFYPTRYKTFRSINFL